MILLSAITVMPHWNSVSNALMSNIAQTVTLLIRIEYQKMAYVNANLDFTMIPMMSVNLAISTAAWNVLIQLPALNVILMITFKFLMANAFAKKNTFWMLIMSANNVDLAVRTVQLWIYAHSAILPIVGSVTDLMVANVWLLIIKLDKFVLLALLDA